MRTTDKPFKIDKRLVYEAYKAVKSNAGAAGVDGETIEQFEADLRNNLYKLWNRMSSGSYFPPPVRAVSIPKKSGGQRILGVPTVADRVAHITPLGAQHGRGRFIRPNRASSANIIRRGRPWAAARRRALVTAARNPFF